MQQREEIEPTATGLRLRRLSDFSQGLVASLSTDELLAKSFDICYEVFDADAASLWLVNDNGHLEALGNRGLSTNYVAEVSRQLISDTISGQVAFEARPLAIEDIQAEIPEAIYEFSRKEGISSFLGAPLLNANHVIGVIAVYFRRHHRFTDADIPFLTCLANMIAIAIANQRMHIQGVASLYALSRQKELLDRVMKNAQDGIIVLDRQRRIVLWSPACERLLGWRATEVLGQAVDGVLRRFVPGSSGQAGQGFQPLSLIYSDAPEPAVELELLTRDGKLRWISASWAPIHEGGQHESVTSYRGAVMILRDISAMKEVDKAKSSLIAMIGHELRTPLTAIRALSELLRDHDYPRVRQREIVTNIHEEALRLGRLVDQVLEAARIDARRIQFEPRSTDLRPIFRQAAQAIEAGLHRTISVHVPPDLPPANVDPDRFRQILDNLLANAAMYSAPDTPITLSAEATADRIMIAVTDQGSGIEAEKVPHIWERFYRAEALDTGRTSGTGLGLHIVKALVELHNGTIGVESKPGAGSTFRITLPR